MILKCIAISYRGTITRASCDLSFFLIVEKIDFYNMVKRLRAYGGCLGTGRRRRSWQAAINLGEEQASFDPGVTESENRLWVNP